MKGQPMIRNGRFPFLAAVAETREWIPRTAWDTLLVQTRDFVVVPTLGSLVPGWILILPKKRCLSLARLTDAELEALDELQRDLSGDLRNAFGSPVVCWENGASEPCQAIGCGVDQAHLHLVPIDVELRAGAEALLQHRLDWEPLNSLSALGQFRDGPSYLLVQETSGGFYAVRDPKPPSQLLRRVVAAKVGCPEFFDWKQYAGEENAIETVARFKSSVVMRDLAVA